MNRLKLFISVLTISVLSLKILYAQPHITNLSPSQNELNINKSSDITVTFDQDMNSATINNSNIKISGLQTGFMNCAVSYDPSTKTTTINPDKDFKTGEEITVMLKSEIQSSTGFAIIPFVYQFTVAAIYGYGIFKEELAPAWGFGIPSDLIPGDFDNDNDLDICIAMTNQQNKITILKNDHTGTFNDTFGIVTPDIFMRVVAGDFDNDGDLDLVTYPGNQQGNIYIYFNNGDRSFSSGQTASDFQGYIADKGDFDGDGDLDLLGTTGNQMKILLNNGSAEFQIDSTYIPDCQDPAAAIKGYCVNDFDNDGDLDFEIIVYSPPYNSDVCSFVEIYKNNGNGKFTGSVVPVIYNKYCNKISSADADGDGDVDIFSNDGVILINNTQSSVYEKVNAYPYGPGTFTTADFDADGDIDLAILSLVYNFNYYINDGSGSFNYDYTMNIDHGYEIMAPGDIDNDGDIDIVSTSSQIGLLTFLIHINTTLVTIQTYLAVQGFYNTDLYKLNMSDTVRAYLRYINPPFEIADSATAVVDSCQFMGDFKFANIKRSRDTYYIQLKHRNALETWSKTGGEVISVGNTYRYDFTSGDSQAFGNNLVFNGIKYCVYSGDVDQNGFIDLCDLVLVYNDAANYVTGYVNSDVTGDGIVDLSDAEIVYNNSNKFISLIRP